MLLAQKKKKKIMLLHTRTLYFMMHNDCSDLLTLEARWAHNERLLEGVGSCGAELRSPRLQGHAPLGNSCHGGSGGLVECRLVV